MSDCTWHERQGLSVAEENPGYPYEVVGITHDGVEETVGWTDAEDGGSLMRKVDLWPRYESGEVRRADMKEPKA